MKLSLRLCSIAKAVLLLSILGIGLDIYVFGTTLLGFSLNVIFTILFVSIANWGCFNKGYNWLAWVIAILSAISVIGMLLLIKYRYTNFEISKAVEDEKVLRDHLGI
jgi:hypothetical protein